MLPRKERDYSIYKTSLSTIKNLVFTQCKSFPEESKVGAFVAIML